MLTGCFNPECRNKLHYLRSGRVVRMIRSTGSSNAVEHFWLCGTCYGRYDFDFRPDGAIGLRHRSRVIARSLIPLTDFLVAEQEEVLQD